MFIVPLVMTVIARPVIELSDPWRRLLLILFGSACAVIVLTGMRAGANLLNPVLTAGFLALLLQPTLHRPRFLGGGAVALVVLVVILAGLALVGVVGVSLQQLALELPQYQEEFEGLLTSLTAELGARGINAAAYIESAITGPAVAGTLLDISGAVAGGFGSAVLTLLTCGPTDTAG